MNKSQLVDSISKKANLSKADAERFVNAGIKVISQSLHVGKDIKLRGVAKFEVVEASERVGRDFSKKELMVIKPRKRIRFKGSPTPH